MVQQLIVGPGVHIVEVSRSQSGAPLAVGLIWMSDRPVAETFALLHTTLTTD
jgi:hypothetical protein